jgi:outer membrane protein assembly factor BamE (lipoprotein component of BamABCDE complex)
MMRRVQQLVWSAGAAGALALLTGGCASIKDHRGYIADRVLIDAVQPGIDNRTSVERTLGRPTFISEFGRKDWYYVSVTTKQHPFQRPRPQDELILRVRFDQGDNVVGVDRAGMEKIARISPDGKATPTLGAKRGLLQDLFGNIGAVGAGGGPSGGGGEGGPGSGPNGS